MCKLAHVIHYSVLSQIFHFFAVLERRLIYAREMECIFVHLFKNIGSNIGKRQISTPHGANTLEPISMKLGIVDYVRDPPQTTLLGVAQRGGLRP